MAAKTLELQKAFNSQLLSMDANGDGTVDLAEYLASGGTKEQFKALDTAGLGKIPVEAAAMVKEEATAAAEEAAPAAEEEAAPAAEDRPGAPSEVTDNT